MSAVSAGKRGQYARSKERRDRITQSVLGIVDELGYERVTTSLVAERSHINEATVLYHFPTKDHLLVAACEYADELMAEATGAATGDPVFDLQDFVRAPQDSEARHRLLVMLRGQSATMNHPARDYFRRRTLRTIAIFTTVISHRQEAGLAHPGIDAADAARQFIALWDGLGGMSLLDLDLDVESALLDGFRRLTGANWMEARGELLRDDLGL